MVHLNSGQKLCFFELSLQNILLISLANPVIGFGNFCNLIKQLAVALEQLKLLVFVGQFEIRFFQLLNNGSSYRLDTVTSGRSVPPCRLSPMPKLARIRNLLRSAETDIGKIAGCISG